MRIAIPVRAKQSDAAIDERFARCPFFCIYDSDTRAMSFIENSVKDASSGVGPQAVELLAREGIKQVYALEIGPRARSLMNKMDINMNIISSGSSIREVIAMSKPQKKS